MEESRQSRKRKAPGTSNVSQIQEWLEDVEEELSDFDDTIADQDYAIEEEIQEESEMSGSEEKNVDSEEKENLQQEPTREIIINERSERETEPRVSYQHCYREKNGFVWSKTDYSRTSRTPARNIVSLPRQNTDQMPFPGYEKIRENFFDNEMVDTLVNCTNKKLESYRQQISNYANHELKDTNAVEIRSLLGVQKLRSP